MDKFKNSLSSLAVNFGLSTILFLVVWLLDPNKEILYVQLGFVIGLCFQIGFWLANKLSSSQSLLAKALRYIFLGTWILLLVEGIIYSNFFGMVFGMSIFPAVFLLMIQIRKQKTITWNDIFNQSQT
jgi:hypothetical protein